MIPSKYNFDVSNSSYSLVFNARTGAVVLFNKNSYNLFVTHQFANPIRKLLFELGLYVNQGQNEYDDILDYCRYRISRSRLNKYRILTTTGCNARCSYCYEKGLASHSMSIATANRVADFIVSQVQPSEKIQIEWFGGEPLLNTKAIDIISERIDKDSPDNVVFSSSIITNASRIDDSIIEKISSLWHTNRIQITIDGIYERYEEVKKLGKNSFEHLISVLSSLAKLDINLDIRFNFDKNNYLDIKQIAQFFSTFPYKDRLTFYAAKIFSNNSRRGYFDLEDETMVVDAIMHRYGLVSGLQLLPKVYNTGCMAMYPKFFTIDPQGKLFKCDRRLLDKNSLASVNTTVSKSLFSSSWNDFQLDEKCSVCRLFPLCWGGCKYDRIIGIYPCYLTSRLVESKLSILLDDCISNNILPDFSIAIVTSGKRKLLTRTDSVLYWGDLLRNT